MDLDEIKKILDLMRDNDLAEFELEQDGVKVRLKKHSGPQWSGPPPAPAANPGSSRVQVLATGEAEPVSPLTVASEDVDLAIIKSPIVGTFYRSAEPGAKPFAEIGQSVKKGEVLCIIEAMKLMNEINAECDGEIVKVYVESGQAVHYGERLFAIRLAGSP